MSRKNVLYSYNFFAPQVVSSTITSSSTSVANLDNCSIAVVWSASTFDGFFVVQVRNGPNDSWRNVDFGSTIPITGTSGSNEIQFTQLPFTDMRCSITRTSGSGTISAVITAKTSGA